MSDDRIKIIIGNTDELIADAIKFFHENDKPKLMFNITTGEIAEFIEDIFMDFDSEWFAIIDGYYPIYENGIYKSDSRSMKEYDMINEE